MFEIEYKGANSVVITTKKTKIISDPKISIVGLKDPSLKDAIELATEERFGINSPDARLVIDSPGDFGIDEIDIHGISAQRHLDADGKNSTIFRIEIGDSRIGLVGNILGKLSDEQLEELGLIDVLIIPVGGGGYTMDAVSAAGLVRQIDPKIVIPVHYADPAIKYEVPQGELGAFVSELNVPVETVSKYKYKPAVAGQSMTITEITRS